MNSAICGRLGLSPNHVFKSDVLHTLPRQIKEATWPMIGMMTWTGNIFFPHSTSHSPGKTPTFTPTPKYPTQQQHQRGKTLTTQTQAQTDHLASPCLAAPHTRTQSRSRRVSPSYQRQSGRVNVVDGLEEVDHGVRGQIGEEKGIGGGGVQMMCIELIEALKEIPFWVGGSSKKFQNIDFN